MHKHQAVDELDREVCFSGPVSRDENQAAHGGICLVETCACGAERRTNINGGQVEEGPWVEPQPEKAAELAKQRREEQLDRLRAIGQ